MTISVPVAQDKVILLGTSVVDNTQAYDRNIRAYYQPDPVRMQDLNSIYIYTGPSFIPDVYDIANEQTYMAGQVLFKDNTTVKVTAVGNITVLKQPEEYAAIADTTFTFDTWTKPFSKIQTAIPAGTYNGFTKVVDGVTHELYRDGTSSTGWRYKITYTQPVVEGPDYARNVPYSSYWSFSNYDSSIYWKSSNKGSAALSATSMVSPYDGATYTKGNWAYTSPDGARTYHYVTRSMPTTFTHQTEVNFYTSLDNTSIILNAYCADTADCPDRWLGRTFVLRGGDLYVRTNSGTIETKVVNVPQYAVIYELKEFPNFSKIGATVKYKPFDSTNYTYAKSDSGTMTYSIQSDEAFDTIALGNVRAEHILLKFYDEVNTLLLTVDADIDTSRDDIGNLSSYQTTLVFYNSIDGSAKNAVKINAGGRVDITLTSTSEIRLSTLLPGISARAGMTHLALRNECKDYSTFEYDPFGNADYVDRARVAKYSGNVDIPITNYDKTDRLMQSLGQNVVIINGSNKDSSAVDSTKVFAATQKIGRFMSFVQNTTIKEDDMDVWATYSFMIEEIV